TPAVVSAASVEDGKKLFQANCASCHGLDLEGTEDAPSLIGVGAAAVDFQVGTGRMPMQAHGPQAPVKPVQFTDDQIKSMAEYVDRVEPSSRISKESILDGEDDVANNVKLFLINSAI